MMWQRFLRHHDRPLLNVSSTPNLLGIHISIAPQLAISYQQRDTRPAKLLQTVWFLSALKVTCTVLILLIMHFRYQFCAALALHVISISGSSHPALPAQGIRRDSLSLATLLPRAGASLLVGSELEERQNGQPAQVVLMGCPEMFNEPVHSCSSCGGESPTKPGQCKDSNGSGWLCKCTLSIC